MLQPVTWVGGVYCPPTTFRQNVEHNRARGLPEILLGEARNEPLYVVCSGPSLSETYLEVVGKFPRWALNSAHDWLIDQCLVPTHGVCMAPEPQALDYFKRIQPEVEYLFASQTAPELIDRALDKGAKVTLWHAHCPDEWEVPIKPDEAVYGGGTIGLRTLDLAWILGYRDVHVFGFDACCSPDGRIAVETPTYEDRKKDLRTFVVNGRAFVALPSHARQVEDFASVIRPLTGLSVTFYGDGLMQWAHS